MFDCLHLPSSLSVHAFISFQHSQIEEEKKQQQRGV